jgi:hypothetical protein
VRLALILALLASPALAGGYDYGTTWLGLLPVPAPPAPGSGVRLYADQTTGELSLISSNGLARAIGAQSSETDVASKATAGAGTSVSPWTGWDTAITWSAFTRYRFRSGHYSYATSPNFLKAGIELMGEAGTYLKHTGTGNAFVMDAGATPGSTWVQSVRVEGLIVLGNYAASPGTATASVGTATVTGTGTNWLTSVAVGDSITFNAGGMSAESHLVTQVDSNTSLTVDATWRANRSGSVTIGKTTNGFYLRGVRNGTFAHLAAHDVGNAGLWTEACVTNVMTSFRITYHEPTQSTGYNVRPQYGIVTTGRGADYSTIWSFIDPIVEGVQTTGLWFKADSYGNTVIGGTSEGHVGIAIGADLDGSLNTLIGTDIEANASTNDVEIRGTTNRLINVLSDQTVSLLAGQRHAIQGGTYQNLSIANNVDAAEVSLADIKGTFTNSSLSTIRFGNSANNTPNPQGAIGNVLPKVNPLTISAGALATNAQTANVLTVSVAGNFTLSNPTNPTNGQTLTWRFSSSSNHTIAYGNQFASLTGQALPAAFQAGSTTAYLTAIYDSSIPRWHVLQAAGF